MTDDALLAEATTYAERVVKDIGPARWNAALRHYLTKAYLEGVICGLTLAAAELEQGLVGVSEATDA